MLSPFVAESCFGLFVGECFVHFVICSPSFWVLILDFSELFSLVRVQLFLLQSYFVDCQSGFQCVVSLCCTFVLAPGGQLLVFGASRR